MQGSRERRGSPREFGAKLPVGETSSQSSIEVRDQLSRVFLWPKTSLSENDEFPCTHRSDYSPGLRGRPGGSSVRVSSMAHLRNSSNVFSRLAGPPSAGLRRARSGRSRPSPWAFPEFERGAETGARGVGDYRNASRRGSGGGYLGSHAESNSGEARSGSGDPGCPLASLNLSCRGDISRGRAINRQQ